MLYKNFAYSTVATAPSPATSGTSLVVASGEGTKFPSVYPFYCTVWPVGQMPSTSNAEIIRVTNVSTDTFTIVRQQDGTTAKSIAVGYQIAQTVIAKTFKYQNFTIQTDSYIVLDTDNYDVIICNKSSAMTVTLPVATGSGRIIHVKSINTGAVTVDGNTDDTIDGVATRPVDQWDSLMILDYAANAWIVI